MMLSAPNDWNALQLHVSKLRGASLSGILIGQGSMIWHFTDRSSILVQCPFTVVDGAVIANGHGEKPRTSTILTEFLNGQITDVSVDERGLLALEFGQKRCIRIIPDGGGLESYVVNTVNGVFPVF
jgi:hypothetical protein